jgi:hypothetical protein
MAPVQLRQPGPVAPRTDAVDTNAAANARGDAPRPGPADAGRGDLSAAADDPHAQVTLLELLDRVLDKGVVLTGDVTLSVANVDLVYVGLRVLISSVESMRERGGPL